MIYAMVLFPVTSVTLRFQGHWVIIDALDVLCAQLMHDLFAIATFLLLIIFLVCCCCQLHYLKLFSCLIFIHSVLYSSATKHQLAF